MQTRPYHFPQPEIDRRAPAQTVAEFIADLDDGSFTHRPRAPHVPGETRHSYQRRFGANEWNAMRGVRCVGGAMGAASVYRNANRDQAELRINTGFILNGASAEVVLALDADQLRDLACRLLDAAHDLDTLPAALLVEQAERIEKAAA